ncbi:MAG: tyrosine-type recombinase/integrase [Candidatus Phytoplasma stylosanthis]|nr:tyrosine-type recombinase/integrase [Candidatus Phytoplasma stylosanthis]
MDFINEFKIFLKIERNYSPLTVQNYISDVQEFQKFLLKQKIKFNLKNLSKEKEARLFLSYLSNRDLAHTSIIRKIASLKTFYNFLIERYSFKFNIFNLIKFKKVPRKIPQILPEYFIQKLFDNINISMPLGYRNYIILDLLYSCGLRVSELINLKIKNISFNDRQVLIYGKGKKERLIPLHNNLLKMLKYYLSHFRNQLFSKSNKIFLNKQKQNDFLLINYQGNKLTEKGIRIIINKINKKTGEQKNISPHSFRHAFATVLLNNGADLRVVQELLGHSHLKTTQIYTYISNLFLKNQFLEKHPRNIYKKRKIKKEINNE